MFLNFKIKNYRSIGQEITLSFAIADRQKIRAYSEVNDKAISNIACIVGANASGKSNILKGFYLFLRYMCKSYSVPMIREAGLSDTHFCCKNEPMEFSTEFIDEGTQYKYELSILKGEVQKESFSELKNDTKRYNNIFKREMGRIVQNIISVNKQDLDRLQNNMSLMSLLLELNYFGKEGLKTLKNVVTNVIPEFRVSSEHPLEKLNSLTKRLEQDALLLAELTDELRNIDTGIDGLSFGKVSNTAGAGDKEYAAILTEHKIGNRIHPLLVLQESSGTINYIQLFVHLYDIFKNGGLLLADELEDSLHPDITSRIISKFLDSDKNPNNAQILFTTHNPWFLQDLTKTQIFIAEKNSKKETELTRLDDIQGVRNDENYFIKYLAGEYDGRPKIKDL